MRPRASQDVLTAEDFQRGAAAADRRHEPRIPCNRELLILPCSSGRDRRTVGLCDCSAHGLRLVAGAPLWRGERFMVKLRLDKAVTLVVYRVCYCVEMSPGIFHIGAELAEFIGPPSPVIDALLIPKLP
jgi:hypothetical protein